MIWNYRNNLDWGLGGFGGLSQFQDEVNRLFNRGFSRRTAFPEVNVWANKDRTMVSAKIPGVEQGDLALTLQNGLLTIKGERKPATIKDGTSVRRERENGSFSRTVRLPYEVENEQVKADFVNGILTITVPRKAESKPKQINISAG